jgi:acyl carrier protein
MAVSQTLSEIESKSAAVLKSLLTEKRLLTSQNDDELIQVDLQSLGLDSLDQVEFIMAIESEFGIDLDPLEIRTVDSISKLAAIIQKYQEK